MILFERIKSVLTIMMKGTHSVNENEEDDEEKEQLKEHKIIMTEIMSLLLK